MYSSRIDISVLINGDTMHHFLKFVVLCVGLVFSLSAEAQDIKPVVDLPYRYMQGSRDGWEERGPTVAKWLIPTVLVSNGRSGSGTMVYYDSKKNYVYVISCGHLFSRGRGSNDGQQVYIEVFYQGTTKLQSPKRYVGEVVCHVWGDDSSTVYDCSLLRFHPDWKNVICAPIGPIDFPYTSGVWLHSVGCDNRSETAHYLVSCIHEQMNGGVTEIVTQHNAPRGGRSGGGLFSENGELVGICSRGGGNVGYWTSLKQIHRFLKEEGCAFVLDSHLARKLPVVDRNNPQGRYAKDYVAVPGRGS